MSVETDHPPIRTYVRRLGRMTPGQKKALIDNSQFLLDINTININTNWAEIFQMQGEIKLALEIGFGMGEGAAQTVVKNPDYSFIEIDVHTPGVGKLLSLLEINQSNNARVIEGDVIDLLTNKTADDSLALCKILFPDPWPKARHHKRRLISEKFISSLQNKLQNNALLHIATDFDEYANSIAETLEPFIKLKPLSNESQKDFAPAYLPKTKFHQRAINEGRQISNFYFQKIR